MMYTVRYVRDQKEEVHTLTRVGALALVDYMKRKFRIVATMQAITSISADK